MLKRLMWAIWLSLTACKLGSGPDQSKVKEEVPVQVAPQKEVVFRDGVTPQTFLGLANCKLAERYRSGLDTVEVILPAPIKDASPEETVKHTARVNLLSSGTKNFQITEGLDLYNRSGAIAQVSGALYSGDKLQAAVKLIFNPLTRAREGYLDLQVGEDKQTIKITCDWSARADLFGKPAESFVDDATLNPSSNPQ